MDQDRGYIKTNKCFEESTSHLVNIFILPIAEERLQLKSMARKFSKKNDIIIHMAWWLVQNQKKKEILFCIHSYYEDIFHSEKSLGFFSNYRLVNIFTFSSHNFLLHSGLGWGWNRGAWQIILYRTHEDQQSSSSSVYWVGDVGLVVCQIQEVVVVVQKRDGWGCGVASSYPRQRRSSPNNAYQLTVADPNPAPRSF